MADGKSTFNMFTFYWEREWRQEAAGFMGNVAVILTVHLFVLPLAQASLRRFYREIQTDKIN